jgi:transcriptional regulator with XRE-family HTH domain
MISAVQIRAARMMLGLDQQMLADLAGLSVPTIQRMEASDGVVRGNVASLTRVMTAFGSAGIEFIAEGATSEGGGYGVRIRAGFAATGANPRNRKATASGRSL